VAFVGRYILSWRRRAATAIISRFLSIQQSGTILKDKFMSVIVLVQGTPNHERKEALAEYQQTARTVIAKHGGQVVTRGSGLGSLHGSGNFQVGIVIRFADRAAAEGWYSDPEYQKVLPLRDQAYTVLEINMFQE
jgi:uncharacterized protein (DUF1330 family)